VFKERGRALAQRRRDKRVTDCARPVLSARRSASSYISEFILVRQELRLLKFQQDRLSV
jgi:hypothetical protein